MSLRLSGINPLSYMGVEPYTPPALVIRPFPPTVNDFQNINLGTFWLVRPNSVITLWVLISVEGGTATWVQLYPAGGGGSGASEFPTDSETANELAGVLNIFGDTRVTTSGAGNTVTLHLSGAVPSLFGTNAGNATPSGGLLNILGGTNINTSGSGDTVTVNLNNSVTLAGSFTVEGPIIQFGSFSDGVLQTNGSGFVHSNNGTNGQVLIGGGSAPAWANLTSTGNTVTITNDANSINLETSGGGPSGSVCFSCWQPSDVAVQPVAPPESLAAYIFGTLAVMSIEYNEGAAFYPGDGTGGQAVFTAPVTGKYQFELVALLSRGGGGSGLLQSVYLQIITPTKVWSNTFPVPTGLGFVTLEFSVSANVQLSTDDQVIFRAIGPGSANTGQAAYFVDGPYQIRPRPPYNETQYATRISGSLISEG